MPRGLISLVLHAHLPYVRHPEQRYAVEERWLYEAITECYLPLVDLLLRLFDEGVRARITISISPTLASMLRDPLLNERYGEHLEHLVALLSLEERRCEREPRLAPLISLYQEHTSRACRLWNAMEGDVVGAFAALEEAGAIELITTAATHAFLPLLRPKPFAAAQLALGLDQHELLFRRRPKGLWLPECGYSPGFEEIVGDLGANFVFLESHGVLHGEPSPRFGVHAPVLTPGERVACFARDPECSKQVWSATEGYPADIVYREFFRDIASTRSADELGEYFAPPSATHGPEKSWLPTGLKYYRITGPTEDKELYEPDVATERVLVNARHFVRARRMQAQRLKQTMDMDKPPLMVAPFDAELFGHWWFEGPQFLEAVIRRIASGQDGLELVTPTEYLQRWPQAQVVCPEATSWGDGGYGQVWLNEDNAWIYRHLHAVGSRILQRLKERPALGERSRRALEQGMRELLLAQASDWPFLIRAGTAKGYAEHRIKDHLAQAWALLEQLDAGEVDLALLTRLESMHPLFSGVDILSTVCCSVGEGVKEEECPCSQGS